MRAIYENCVLCDKQTEVLKSTPIELRYNYVENAGQLCPECMTEVNNQHDHENE